MQAQRARKHHKGFTLILCVTLMVLIALIAVGMLGLSSIELRRAAQSNDISRARANAKLALLMALGHLQKQLGPDQRVSAPASLDAAVAQPHWTGVWSTRKEDSSRYWTRDDSNGGLRDARDNSWDRQALVQSWLVSGNDTERKHKPTDSLPDDQSIALVDRGTTEPDAPASEAVRAPMVKISHTPSQQGRFAYWIGDEGIKANIATPHAYAGTAPNPAEPGNGGYFSLVQSQASSLPGLKLEEQAKEKIATQEQISLAGTTGSNSVGSYFHHTTTHSLGVLANVQEGRLKRDLTAFIESSADFPALPTSPGLASSDRMVGPANADAAAALGQDWSSTRHQKTAPRFGLLREWAKIARSTSIATNATLDAITPLPEQSPKNNYSVDVASTNYKPASLMDYKVSSVGPVIVEASTLWTYSYYPNPSVPGGLYQYRRHMYPRVVLWNPYNARVTMPALIVMMQGNGRFELLETVNWYGWLLTYGGSWGNDGRGNNFASNEGFEQSAGYTEAYVGSNYFTVPATTFEPGECLVFSTARGQEYDERNIAANLLSCTTAPDVSRCFFLSNQLVNAAGAFVNVDYFPTRYQFNPLVNVAKNQADDQRIVAKVLGQQSSVNFAEFDRLPQYAYISTSLQYGGGREPRLAQRTSTWQNVERTATTNPRPTILPDIRSREGMRLRWFREHASNRNNTGPLRNTSFLEEAPLATWNPRAAYATRSPWDNIGGTLATSGSGGGPWFFGIYTRDLYDQAVSWNDQVPVFRNGKYYGNPFGTPMEGKERIVLFDVPRTDVGLVSLGQLQHAKFSDFVWHPSYAFGNSLADPRLASGKYSGLDRTAPPLSSSGEKRYGGFDRNNIGWSPDAERSGGGPDTWAMQGRAIYQDLCDTDNLVYDLSYELNHSMWDDFFLSTGQRYDKDQFLSDPLRKPLPNGRLRLLPSSRGNINANDLMDLHRPARHLLLDGAFNVNSTSVAAWEALLRSTQGLGVSPEGIRFSRILNPRGGEWKSSSSGNNQDAWDGSRMLSADEVHKLAVAIVEQVKLRGPFLSLADFVNRRLRNDDSGRSGTLQAAIDATGLNQSFRSSHPLNNQSSLPNYRHPDNIADPTRLEQTLKPDSMAWGIPGYLTQADVLQVIGSTLSARSDTFRIRAYGDATDASGKVLARAYCEAIVQRLPDPLDPDPSGLNPAKQNTRIDFGRKFQIVSFRWMKAEEI